MTNRIFNRLNGLWFTAVACIIALNAGLSSSALAASAKEIDTGVDESIVKFEKEVKNGKNFLDSSKGILVFPKVRREGLALEESMAKVRSGSQARRSITTACYRVHLDCNSGRNQDRLDGVSG